MRNLLPGIILLLFLLLPFKKYSNGIYNNFETTNTNIEKSTDYFKYEENSNFDVYEYNKETEPSVSFVIPVEQSLTLELGNEKLIQVIANDFDGHVSSISFYVNNFPAYTDFNEQDNFTYNFVAGKVGDYYIKAIAYDNKGMKATSDSILISVFREEDTYNYTLQSVSGSCANDYILMPIITRSEISDVIGYDIVMKYDYTKVYPTGNILMGNDLVEDSDWISYRMKEIDNSLIRISLYFNSQSQNKSSFNGEGNLCSIEFYKTVEYNNRDMINFSIDVITESYSKYVSDKHAYEGSYYPIYEDTFRASVTAWNDNKSIDSLPGQEHKTFIYGNKKNTEIIKLANNGIFSYNTKNGMQITILRDINNNYDVQPFISGRDAFLLNRVLTDDATFKPSIFQILAMDVNRDGTIDDGDLMQLQLRSVGKSKEFIQVSNRAKDWIFIPSSYISYNPSYTISKIYPHDDGVGYSKYRVPQDFTELEIPIKNSEECPTILIEKYKGIVLGDISGNYGDPVDTLCPDSSFFDIHIVSYDNEYYNVEIEVFSCENISSADLNLSLVDTAVFSEVIEKYFSQSDYNILNNNNFRFTSYISGNVKSKKLIQLKVENTDSLMEDNIEVTTSLINEKEVGVRYRYSLIKEKKESYEPLEVNIYPNPTYGKLKIVCNALNVNFKLYNLNGIIYEQFTNEDFEIDVNLEQYRAGVYILMAVAGNATVRKMIMRRKEKEQ